MTAAPFCTLEFASLAAQPFSHTQTGDLAQIHAQGVNAVVGNRTFSPAAQRVIDACDVTAMAQPFTSSISPYRANLGEDRAIEPHKLFGSIAGILQRLLPPHPDNESIAHDLALMLGDMSEAYKNQPGYSGRMDYILQARLAGTRGSFHRDSDTFHRGFIVIKGKGTWCADNSLRQEHSLPEADTLRETETGPNRNRYGRPSPELAHLLRQAPAGRPMIWHGELAGMAEPDGQSDALRLRQSTCLIHSEVDIATPAESRLTLVATPTEMQARASRLISRRYVMF